jgi:hypothetical protein
MLDVSLIISMHLADVRFSFQMLMIADGERSEQKNAKMPH